MSSPVLSGSAPAVHRRPMSLVFFIPYPIPDCPRRRRRRIAEQELRHGGGGQAHGETHPDALAGCIVDLLPALAACGGMPAQRDPTITCHDGIFNDDLAIGRRKTWQVHHTGVAVGVLDDPAGGKSSAPSFASPQTAASISHPSSTVRPVRGNSTFLPQSGSQEGAGSSSRTGKPADCRSYSAAKTVTQPNSIPKHSRRGTNYVMPDRLSSATGIPA